MVSALLVNFLHQLKGHEVCYIADWRTEFALLQTLLSIESDLPLISHPELLDLNDLRSKVKPEDWQSCYVKYQPDMTALLENLEESSSPFCFLDLKQLPEADLSPKLRSLASQNGKIIILEISLPHEPIGNTGIGRVWPGYVFQ